ncbi:VOC family protein [Deinococcus aquiradiocola]|uniref:Glyoxalase n=1 Tax=Deinococcus aquiradiocola TaxID=393059 RepID=A0A917PK81_9DEIO|nr:VOC family protein [Deinococcus aquiradiocola]GGJ82015.1 glyoxalase [Deinococcus aquiradiocola]
MTTTGTVSPASPAPHLPGGLSVGPVTLGVTDLARSTAFYTQGLGLRVLHSTPDRVTLGVPARPLLTLNARPGRPAPPSSPGLYHLALLLPTRADLGRFVRHMAGLGARLGQGDHLVSEALYLNDPDGHGIEVYRDRPRSEWTWHGTQVEMDSRPVDIQGLLREAGPDAPYAGLPDGTVMGHVHLRVTDLAATEAFYAGVLGFDIVSRFSGQALFVSAGGYHHHLGLNTWQSLGGTRAPAGSAQLERATLVLPDAADLDALAARLAAAGVSHERDDAGLHVQDPAGNPLLFTLA